VIIGTGFAGLGMAIRLKQEGVDDFVVLEKADDVGGTWRENTYPGVQCDVPSHLYSFSFAPNPNWSRTFPLGDEIWDYLRECAVRYGVMPHIRFGEDVQSADWDDERQRWRIETADDTITAQVLVAGTGPLHEPSIPAVPGLDRFEGRMFHSAEWEHDHDLTGERVAVVGTGASAIQFVPRIQPKVSRMHVFQRTPPWIMPHPDRALSPLEHRVYRAFPAAQLAMRAAVYWARETFVLGFMDRRFAKLPERRGGQAPA
jgi:cation diffusion facilitator CzcD-associated flavoprotein CzcO